ncbi:MAG: tRNA-dihydrouridine synthase [Patescibacteria group bacterium]
MKVLKENSENFWQKLKRQKNSPIFVLAPMADVTDAAFRRLIAARGKPDVMWTEFVSADGLIHADALGRSKLMKDLIFTEAERPIVAQFFTSKPENMEKVARLARELGFDGIDINMGCPDKSIEKQGAGAALIKTPALAREIIAAAKRGAVGSSGDLSDALPVSIKTRIGFNKNELDTWLPALLAENPAVVTIHARTRKEMSKVPARWEEVKRAVEIRNEVQGALAADKQTLIFGNGDVKNLAEAEVRARESGADGVMLGRAIFGNPWLFDRTKSFDSFDPTKGISIKERLETLVEHSALFEEILGETKNFAIMKKHFKAYVNGWDGAKELRLKLMEANAAGDVRKIIEASGQY